MRKVSLILSLCAAVTIVAIYAATRLNNVNASESEVGLLISRYHGMLGIEYVTSSPDSPTFYEPTGYIFGVAEIPEGSQVKMYSPKGSNESNYVLCIFESLDSEEPISNCYIHDGYLWARFDEKMKRIPYADVKLRLTSISSE